MNSNYSKKIVKCLKYTILLFLFVSFIDYIYQVSNPESTIRPLNLIKYFNSHVITPITKNITLWFAWIMDIHYIVIEYFNNIIEFLKKHLWQHIYKFLVNTINLLKEIFNVQDSFIKGFDNGLIDYIDNYSKYMYIKQELRTIINNYNFMINIRLYFISCVLSIIILLIVGYKVSKMIKKRVISSNNRL